MLLANEIDFQAGLQADGLGLVFYSGHYSFKVPLMDTLFNNTRSSIGV